MSYIKAFDEEIIHYEDGRECINSTTFERIQCHHKPMSSIEIDFDDEIFVLIFLASLPNSWEAMRMAVNNSIGNSKLKYNDMRDLILAKEVRRRDASEYSGFGFALNLEHRGRSNSKGHNDRFDLMKGHNQEIDLSLRKQENVSIVEKRVI